MLDVINVVSTKNMQKLKSTSQNAQSNSEKSDVQFSDLLSDTLNGSKKSDSEINVADNKGSKDIDKETVKPDEKQTTEIVTNPQISMLNGLVSEVYPVNLRQIIPVTIDDATKLATSTPVTENIVIANTIPSITTSNTQNTESQPRNLIIPQNLNTTPSIVSPVTSDTAEIAVPQQIQTNHVQQNMGSLPSDLAASENVIDTVNVINSKPVIQQDISGSNNMNVQNVQMPKLNVANEANGGSKNNTVIPNSLDNVVKIAQDISAKINDLVADSNGNKDSRVKQPLLNTEDVSKMPVKGEIINLNKDIKVDKQLVVDDTQKKNLFITDIENLPKENTEILKKYTAINEGVIVDTMNVNANPNLLALNDKIMNKPVDNIVLPELPMKPDMPVEHQIVDNVKQALNEKVKEFSMQLYPKDLGKITVKMSLVQGLLTVELSAINPKTQSLLFAHSNEIKSALGIQTNEPVQVIAAESKENYQQSQHDASDSNSRNGNQQQENHRENKSPFDTSVNGNETNTKDFLSFMQNIKMQMKR